MIYFVLVQKLAYRVLTRENELREPIPHIGLCTHEPRSSIFKRNVIGQTVTTLKTQKFKSVVEELLNLVLRNVVNIRE